MEDQLEGKLFRKKNWVCFASSISYNLSIGLLLGLKLNELLPMRHWNTEWINVFCKSFASTTPAVRLGASSLDVPRRCYFALIFSNLWLLVYFCSLCVKVPELWWLVWHIYLEPWWVVWQIYPIEAEYSTDIYSLRLPSYSALTTIHLIKKFLCWGLKTMLIYGDK